MGDGNVLEVLGLAFGLVVAQEVNVTAQKVLKIKTTF